MSKSSWWLAGEKPGDAVIPDNVRPQRGKKDTKRWCKGKVGREHKPVLVVHHYNASLQQFHGGRGVKKPLCYESTWSFSGHHWHCGHALQCTECGKYTQTWLGPEQCPDSPVNRGK